ncbi:MAG: hypothetical protein CMH92_16055 [Oceanicaulis sp.]|uniref:3'-5' exonuclease n=1 Tax=Oceanicaulis sp. UBA6590 TaxID=1947008 RepID=UPI000C3A7E04|nr:hypothetical protein [Oceanicaulis sp. UBA6590]MBG37305.1 hypothetical protein [Oceanicaulis sp.]HBU61580.1 hypothetical protein [Oceanicaulis sp.]
MSDDARLKRRVLDKRTRRHRRPLPSVERGVQMAAYAVHTTGLAPSDRVCELGVATLELVLKAREDSAPRVTDVQSALVDPGMAIAPAATEVHGVTDKMVQGQPSFTSVWSRLGRPAPWIAAHNADFALMHLPVSKDRMICTLACARLLMPEQQHFSLDALVQGLDLPRPDNAATRAAIGPGAGLDAWNVAWLTERLTRLAAPEELAAITAQAREAAHKPADITGSTPLPFGKHRGRALSDEQGVPTHYVAWIAGNYTGRDAGQWRAAASKELTRRHADPCDPSVYQIARGAQPRTARDEPGAPSA